MVHCQAMRSGLRESLSSAAAEAAAMASSAAGIGGGFLMERQTGHGMESWDCADCLFSDCHVMSCHAMSWWDMTLEKILQQNGHVMGFHVVKHKTMS